MFSFVNTVTVTQQTSLFPYTTLFRSGGGAPAKRALLPCSSPPSPGAVCRGRGPGGGALSGADRCWSRRVESAATTRSEEHTSELQSPCNLECRLLLEIKKYQTIKQ